jgi:Flp pilus assembly pilin Flp
MTLRRFLRCEEGAGAAEFALVAPLMIILLFAVIDGGRFLWEVNQAEKATQVGARVAVVTDIIASGIADYSYVGCDEDGNCLTQGDKIPGGAFGTIACTNTSCACIEGATCPTDVGEFNDEAFTRIVDRMRLMKPDIGYGNVEIEYHDSGLGFAGDPNGPDASPMVTVRLKDLEFRPITTLAMTRMYLPSFATTLTAEDSAGSVSN